MQQRFIVALAGVLLAALACARAPKPAVAPAPIAPIDLSPRCLEIEGLPPLAAPLEEAMPESTLTPLPLPHGIEGWQRIGPASPFVKIAVGFAWPRDARADAEVAATALREGLTTADPAAFRARVAETGAQLRVDIEEDRLWLSIAAPHAHADALFALLADALEIHELDADAFGRTRRRTRLTQLAAESAPTALARARLDQWLGDAVAEPEPVTNDAADHAAKMRKALVPRASTRVLLLDSRERDAPRLRAKLADWLGSSSDGGIATQVEPSRGERAAPPADDALDPGDVLLVDRRGAPQVEVLVALPNATPDPDDTAALELLASAVGGNVGGRLFVDLRERRGLVYSIDATQDPRRVFIVSTRARAERVPALLDGIEAHLRALFAVELLPCEVRTWQQRMLGELSLRQADPAAAYAELRRALSARGDETVETAEALPDVAAERAAILALDAANLREVARRHLAAAPVIVLVGDRPQLEAAFEAVAPERRLREIDERGRVD